MQLFYAPDFRPPCHTLTEEESKHCIRVLRLRRGDDVYITDGRGRLFRCAVESDDPRGCTVRVVETRDDFGRPPCRLTMLVAPTKNIDRFEWFLEKTTEVGTEAIVPLLTARSERRVFNRERGEKVLIAAMKQSLKCRLPQLSGLTPFEQALSAPFAGRQLIAHCAEARTPAGKAYLPETLRPGQDVRILIGPEGDFSPEEIDRAVALGFEEITLGEQRLRTETAAIAAAVMVSVVNTLGHGKE